MTKPPERLRARLLSFGYRKRCNVPHSKTLSLFTPAQSAFAISIWKITFACRVKFTKNHDICKFAVSGPIDQKQLKNLKMRLEASPEIYTHLLSRKFS
jgi:hypothetical protein